MGRLSHEVGWKYKVSDLGADIDILLSIVCGVCRLLFECFSSFPCELLWTIIMFSFVSYYGMRMSIVMSRYYNWPIIDLCGGRFFVCVFTCI